MLGPLGATAPLCNPGNAQVVPPARILKRSRDSKRPELKDVPHPVNSAEFSVSCASIHDNVSQTGSNGAAALSEWTAIVSWRGLTPSQAPIFALCYSPDGVVVVDIFMTRLGVRSYRCPPRARQRGCARSRSASRKTQCCPLTIMGGAAVPMSSCPEELRGHGMDQARPTATSTAEGSEIMTWTGRPASLACSGDLPLKR